jgi:hypothetical protein
MNQKLAKVISILFHPILMPTLMAILIVYSHPQQFTDTTKIHNEVRLMYYGAITIIFPLFSLFLMRKLDIISSYAINDSKERFIPLIAIGTFWLWTYFMFKEDGLYLTSSYYPIGIMTLGSLISLFILFPLNFVSNVSWQMVGAGALISLILNILPTSQYNLIYILLAAIVEAGLIASAQLVLDRSNKSGLMLSFLIGFFGQFVAFNIWHRLLSSGF